MDYEAFDDERWIQVREKENSLFRFVTDPEMQRLVLRKIFSGAKRTLRILFTVKFSSINLNAP